MVEGCLVSVEEESGNAQRGAGEARIATSNELSLREGDVLVVWRLDRLGRSLQNLIELVGQL